MSNKNYIKGRAFEYKVVKRWSVNDFMALRTAGSHSPFDVVAYKTRWYGEDIATLRPGETIELTKHYEYKTTITPIIGYGIQCKVRKRKGIK